MKKQNYLLFGLVGALVVLSGTFSFGWLDQSEPLQIQEKPWVSGVFTIIAAHADGSIYAYVQTPNLVVDQGMDTMADLIWPDINLNGNATDNQFKYINIGEGATGPTAVDVTLETLIAGCNRQLDTAVTGTSGVSGEITATIDFAFDGGICTGTITEAAIFNSGTGAAAAAGEMLARATFGGITIGSGDTLTVTYDVTIT